MKRTIILIVVILMVGTALQAQTTEFTYQGSLQVGPSPTLTTVNYDFEFRLCTSDTLSCTTGPVLVGTDTHLNVPVTDGIFTVKLNFSATNAFDGSARWLLIGVKPAGDPGAYQLLAPRQQVMSTPYAIKSKNADNSQQLGGFAANQYLQTSGNGSALTNLNASSITTGTLAIGRGGTGSSTQNFVDLSTDQISIGGNKTFTGNLRINGNLGLGVGDNSVKLAVNSTGLNGTAYFQASPAIGPHASNIHFGPTGDWYIRSANIAGKVVLQDTGGNVGIGNTSPSERLHVAGNGLFTGNISGNIVNAATQFNLGNSRVLSSPNASDLFVGIGAGTASGGTNSNSFFGTVAGTNNQSGYGNTFLGTAAGNANTTGFQNTAIGFNASFTSNNLNNATAIGANAIATASHTVVLGGVFDEVQVPGNLKVTGAIAGKGAVPWQAVSELTQQAQPNTGYLVTNEAQVTVTLPASPAVGDIVRVSGTGAGGWKAVTNAGQFIVPNITVTGENWIPHESSRSWESVASSADGTKLIAAVRAASGRIYTSTDSGNTWLERSPVGEWLSVASSADGTRLVAVGPGQIHVSNDSGNTWAARGPVHGWTGVASSADGQKLVAVPNGGQIYTSNNFGDTWTASGSSPSLVWSGVASSSDGTKLIAAPYDDTGPNFNPQRLYTSNDSGVTWVPVTASGVGLRHWGTVASSADGSSLAAVTSYLAAGGGQMFISTDAGVSWAVRETTREWYSITFSADGTKAVAAVDGGRIYTSFDSGLTWRPRESVRFWRGVASSANGTNLIAVAAGGRIYTTTILDVPIGRASYVVGGQFSSIEMQYVGNGLFLPIGQIGSTVAYY